MLDFPIYHLYRVRFSGQFNAPRTQHHINLSFANWNDSIFVMKKNFQVFSNMAIENSSCFGVLVPM
jgi:hypothetical protein